MGLTAAEAFMLISFILLLMLTWRFLADKELQDELEQEREFSIQFTPEQRSLALKYQEHLPEFEKHIGSLDPKLIEDRLRLVEEEMHRALLESVQHLPEDVLLRLVDMVSTENLAKRLQNFETFEQAGITVEKVQQLQAEVYRIKNSREQLADQLQAFEQAGITVEKVQQLQAEVDRIKNSRQGIERSGADVARQLRSKAGDEIEKLGGRILDSGDVVFPDGVLFEAGVATIRPTFDTLLKAFCRPWFEVLYNEDRYLETVQIEGHASSEFGSLNPREAFDANLDLSQLRASAVFKKCLDYGGDDEVADWARSKMAAIGYSSARPVFRNNAEDRKASRRVVFAIDMKSADEVVTSQDFVNE